MSLSARKRKNRGEPTTIESEDLFGIRSPVRNTKKQKAKDDTLHDSSVFGELATKSGFVLKKGDQPNILTCDQAVFQKNLKKEFLLHPHRGNKIIDQFIKAFEDHIKDKLKLKWSLLYTQTSPNCTSCRGGQQDSLVRLLLNIDEVQPKLIILLTEKLFEVAYDDEENERVDLPRLILANLRWLDHIVDPSILTDKVVDLLKGSPLEIQKEIVSFVPNIVIDEDHPRISEVLCELYESTPELTAAILDSLSYLTLEAEKLQDIHHSVLKSLATVKGQNLPVVVKFLLHNTPSSLAYQVVSDIREKVHLPGDRRLSARLSQSPSKKSDKINDDLEVIIFSNIKMALLIYKSLSNAWIKAIVDVEDMKGIREFDLLMLSMIYQTLPSRRKSIESLMRNLIRKGLPIEPLLSSTFINHAAVLKEYFEAVKKIAELLIRSPQVEIVQYGVAIYRNCFLHLDHYQQQDVILSLLSHLGDNENIKLAALALLSELAHKNTEQMSKYTLFLKSSLDIMDTLSLREAKQLMDGIIHLAHFSCFESSLREELSILIRKQLSHSDIKFKRLGVLGAVLTLKNTVGLNGTNISEGTSEDTSEDDSVSSEALKEAESLFQNVKESTLLSPPSSALFMDELATNILKNGLNPKLEKWISGKMIGDFETTFVIEGDEEPTSDSQILPVSVQWNIDDVTESEQEKAITVAIATFVFKEYQNKEKEKDARLNPIITLAPHFRLMRMVESHLNEGKLDSIDALLGCGVQMPNASVYSKFSSLSEKEQTVSLSCLFYAINWFRELVNAFVTQKEKEFRKRVYLRLRKIIALQDLLKKLLPLKPSYVPPPAVFDFDITTPQTSVNMPSGSGVKNAKKPAARSGGKKKGKADEANMSMVVTLQSQTQKNTTTNLQGEEIADLSKFKPFFRELHMDVFILLFRGLSLDVDLDEENVKYLSLQEAEFLLCDLNHKFSRIFEGRPKRLTVLGKPSAEKDIGYSHFDIFSAEEVAQEAMRYMKPICAHLEKISEFFQGLMSDADNIEDAPSLFTERTMPITNLFTALLTCLKTFLSWSSLHSPEHSDPLTKILRMLSLKLEPSSVTELSHEDLVRTAFRYFSNFASSIVCIQTAVALVSLLEAILAFSNDGQLKKKLVEIILTFLKKEWYTYGGSKEKGTTLSRNICAILTICFAHTSDPVAQIYEMTSGIKEIAESKNKDPTSDTYPTLKKSTLTVFYPVLFGNLVSGTSRLVTSASSKAGKLQVWNLSIKTLHGMVEPLRSITSSLMMAFCLKHSHAFLELFLRKGMPLMDKLLQTNHTEVMSLLKNLQFTTRFLQHLCNHVKSNQETAVRLVPITKRSLETIVFRVKAMLALNNCSDAFWLGNLKNRDLQGEELLSQSQTTEDRESSENEEGETVVYEQHLSDVEVDEDSNDAGEPKPRGHSCSEVF